MTVIRMVAALAASWLLASSAPADAPAWQQEAESILAPEQLRNGATVVEDPQASGGKAIRVPWAKSCQGPFHLHLGMDHVPLHGRNLFTLYLRGREMLPLDRGVTVSLIAHDRVAGTRLVQDSVAYGINLRPEGYTPVTFTLDTPFRRAECLIEIGLRWQDQPEGAAPAVLVDRVEIRPQPLNQPVLREIVLDKARYAPKEKAGVRVRVVNPTDRQVEAALTGEELDGFSSRRSVFEEPLTLQPGEERQVTCAWQLGERQYGHELAVRLVVGGKEVDRAAEPFAVCDTPLWLSVGNEYDRAAYHAEMHSLFYVRPCTVRESAEAVRFWRKLSPGVEYWEFFSWSPGDISDLAPVEEPHPGGEGPFCYRSRETLIRQNRLLHEAGLWPISYVNGTCWGESGYQLFARHPEWFIFDSNGEVAHYEMDRRELYRRKDDVAFDPESFKEIFFQGVLNTAMTAPQDYTARQFVRCGREMGFKGVRMDVRYLEVHPGERDFDGRPIVSSPQEADRTSAAAIRRVKDLIRREIPDFTFGYNFGAPEEVQEMPLSMRERCAGGGWILDELPCTYQEKNSPYHLWPAYLRRMVSWGDQVRQWGGIYNPFDFRRGGPNGTADRIYSAIFRLIAGGRTYNSSYFHNSRLPVGDLGRLATRYSELFFGKDRRWIADPAGTVEVRAAAPLWWKDTVFWNTSQGGRRQLIVNLVNPPKVMEVEENPQSEIRPPVTGIEVICGPAEGTLPKAAWLVTGEPMTLMEPARVRQVPLVIQSAEAGKVRVAAPAVIFWKMVVLEF